MISAFSEWFQGDPRSIVLALFAAVAAAVVTYLLQRRTQLIALERQYAKNDEIRQKEMSEKELAHKRMVGDGALSFLSQVHEITEIGILDKRTKEYRTLQSFVQNPNLDPGKPQSNRAASAAFALGQVLAGFKIILSERNVSPASEEHQQFLSLWHTKIIPSLTSRSYPGDPYLYPEQVDILATKLIVPDLKPNTYRPMHWAEFVELFNSDESVKTVIRSIWDQIADVFDDSKPPEIRTLKQARLAMISILLNSIRERAKLKPQYDEAFKLHLGRLFAHEEKRKGAPPKWYVMTYNDVAEWAEPERQKLGLLPASEKTGKRSSMKEHRKT